VLGTPSTCPERRRGRKGNGQPPTSTHWAPILTNYSWRAAVEGVAPATPLSIPHTRSPSPSRRNAKVASSPPRRFVSSVLKKEPKKRLAQAWRWLRSSTIVYLNGGADRSSAVAEIEAWLRWARRSPAISPCWGPTAVIMVALPISGGSRLEEGAENRDLERANDTNNLSLVRLNVTQGLHTMS